MAPAPMMLLLAAVAVAGGHATSVYGACESGVCEVEAEEVVALQVGRKSSSEQCPGSPSHVQCSGAQCCPGVAGSNWQTFPCPSAPHGWNGCQGSWGGPSPTPSPPTPAPTPDLAVDDLVAIKKKNTNSGKTEVSVMSASSNYNHIVFETPTGLHETDSDWDFLMEKSSKDLVSIKKAGTSSGRTEVHILSASSSYQDFSVHTQTLLPETGRRWAFALRNSRDLVAIEKSGSGSHRTDVWVLSASSNYQRAILQTATALHETDSDWDFVTKRNGDLVGIKKAGTSNGKTEVHVLSASSNYQTFVLQTETALHETDEDWAFVTKYNDDLVAIKKRGTGSGMTEVHVMSAASNYKNFVLQTGTALHETNKKWDFTM